MIKPIKAIVGRTTLSDPVPINPQKAYSDNINYNRRGEKLDINCNEVRCLTRNGLKLDCYA